MSSNQFSMMPTTKSSSLKPRRFFCSHEVDGLLTPQDSDTDSGISADCDQGSPRCGSGTKLSSEQIKDRTQYQNIQNQISADYLTPNSARKISTYSTSRRLPLQPQRILPTLNKTKYRVRFADEVDSGASTSSGASSTHISPRFEDVEKTSRKPSLTVQSLVNCVQRNNEINQFSNNNELNNVNHSTFQSCDDDEDERKVSRRQQLNLKSQSPQTLSTEQFQNIIEPPSYNVAVQRLRSVKPPIESFRDAYIRKNVADTLQRCFRQRSSSLPRGKKFYYEENNCFDSPQVPSNQHSSLMMGSQHFPGSLDNLHTMGSMKRRKLPTAPLMGSQSQLQSQKLNNLTVCHALQFQLMQDELRRQTPTFGQHSHLFKQFPTQKYNSPNDSLFDLTEFSDCNFSQSGVRAQLIALDQRGFRRVLVEKRIPGPFGFYIAVGVISAQRGIFISRVSIPSLSPMLTVGDEIIYVDDELIKGQSLEYVQSMIAGKTLVTITLLPAVGKPSMC